MFDFLKNQFLLHFSRPTLWLTGIVFWCVESFVFLLLLQPSGMLTFSQKMGLFWGVMIFSHVSLTWQLLTVSRLSWLVEVQQLSECSIPVWLIDLFCFWCMYALLFVLIIPFACFFYGLSFQQVLFLYVLWLITSPVCFLQIYLSRLIALFMRHGMALSLLVLMPWMIPELLLTVRCLHTFVLGQFSSQQLCFLLGFNMSIAAITYRVICEALGRCYHHLHL